MNCGACSSRTRRRNVQLLPAAARQLAAIGIEQDHAQAQPRTRQAPQLLLGAGKGLLEVQLGR